MSQHDHPSMRSVPDDLFIVTEDDRTIYLAPLLSCGHYGNPIFENSSQWDFPHEALICPVCGEERQMDLRVQLAVMEA